MIQKTFQRRRHMQKFFTFFYGLLILPAFSVLHRPDQYILWRVFHVNKFQDLDIIALPLQILRPQRICYKSPIRSLISPYFSTGASTSL